MQAGSRRRLIPILALASLAVGVVAPAVAHHSFSAEFDVGRPVELTGEVVEIEWTNPHAWVHIETENGERWAIELLGINTLARSGFTPRTVRDGDVLTIVGFGARDGTNTANASTVTRTGTGESLWTSARDRD